jgi:hypothetical protein
MVMNDWMNDWVPLKTARMEKVKAEFWIEPKSAKNISVKYHGWPDADVLGGDFVLRGVLKIQPKGYTWQMEQPFSVALRLDEAPRSGTLVFQPKTKDALSQMVSAAILHSGYGLEDLILKMLGKIPRA